MTEIALRAPRASAVAGCSLLLAALLGLGACAAEVPPADTAGYAQAPGMTFRYNAQMVGAVGAGTSK